MQLSSGLELMQSFLMVAEELNFRRSAERLNVDQSALTRRIQKFEHLLGFRLFERSTREVSLTPAGRSIYEVNSHLLRGFSESVVKARLIAEGKTGKLRVGYMAFAATTLMPTAVSSFRQDNPHIDVQLRYIRTQGQKLALARDEIDIGYLIGPFSHGDFHSERLAHERLLVVMPHGHRLADQDRIVPMDIYGEALILGDMREWQAYRWHLNELFSSQGVPIDISLEASDTLALLGIVKAGLGITILPESMSGLVGDELATRPIFHPDFRIETVLVWKRTNRTRLVRSFVEVANPKRRKAKGKA